MMRWFATFSCATWLLVAVWESEGAPPAPQSPADSTRAIQLRSGMQVELVASEPLVQDPIAIAWGPDGRMWVVEMGDYPLGLDGKGGAGGRVKVLEDTDGDGRYDKARTFLDQLGFPTGVMPWRKGVLLTCAPEIFYAEDTDGDGKADRREVLFSGFPERNQQHRVNGLQWGLDNWVHCANGDGGVGGETVIECRKQGGKRIELGGRDFRFRPDTGELDPQTGTTQFGRNRDDWGNWFGSNNAQPLYHFVLGDEYLRRNPYLVPPDPRKHLLTVQGPFFAVAPNIPVHGETSASGPGPFRVGLGGPCSGVIYRDTLLGEEYTGNAFVCDPVTNLVHREILEPRGVTYSARRAFDETAMEFFASRDSWTRPTMARTGPDGALWIVDMYRLVIEHPQWISAAAKKELDLRAGHDLGRIYRMWREGKEPRKFPRLDRMNSVELVAALDSPSGWQRDMAQQMLLWRADPVAMPRLDRMASSSENPLARLHALWTLEGLGRLTAAHVERALQDAHPEIRRNALRLSEPFLRREKFDLIKFKHLVKDPSAPVRLQLALSLGESPEKLVVEWLADLAIAGDDEPYLNAAVLSALQSRGVGRLLSRLMNLDPHLNRQAKPDQRIPVLLLQQAAALAGVLEANRKSETAEQRVATELLFTSFDNLRYPVWKLNAIAAWFEGGGELRHLHPVMQKYSTDLLFQTARKMVADSQSSIEQRMAYLGLLGRDPATRQVDLTAVASQLKQQSPPDLQMAAVERLSQFKEEQIPKMLLAGWAGHTPAIRGRILDTLLSRESWTVALVKELEAGTVAPAELDAPRRQRMRDHASAAVREPARRMFVESTPTERQKLIDNYRQALSAKTSKPGDVSLGRGIFEKRCSICHRLGNLGKSVGPDLTAYTAKPVDEWLIAMLDPNRAVEPRYASYTVTTRRGLTVAGILSDETAVSLKLYGPDGQAQKLLRTEIEELRNSGKSLMPEGLEKDLSHTDMANLLAFARGVPRYRRKVVAGNQPELVISEGDGSLRMLASNGEIFGEKMTVNLKSQSLVGMSQGDNFVQWNFESPRSRQFIVEVTWAHPDSKPVPVRIEVGRQEITGVLERTEGPGQFRKKNFGLLEIPAGRSQLMLRVAGISKEALFQVREVRLIPKSPD